MHQQYWGSFYYLIGSLQCAVKPMPKSGKCERNVDEEKFKWVRKVWDGSYARFRFHNRQYSEGRAKISPKILTYFPLNTASLAALATRNFTTVVCGDLTGLGISPHMGPALLLHQYSERGQLLTLDAQDNEGRHLSCLVVLGVSTGRSCQVSRVDRVHFKGWGHGARCRVRTCDPIRVKDVLYR